MTERIYTLHVHLTIGVERPLKGWVLKTFYPRSSIRNCVPPILKFVVCEKDTLGIKKGHLLGQRGRGSSTPCHPLQLDLHFGGCQGHFLYQFQLTSFEQFANLLVGF